MLVILDIEVADRRSAATEICQCIEVALIRASREVKARKVPPLYSAGMRYKPQNPAACALRPPSQVLARGGGDCKHLVLWRLAELRVAGEHATPRIIWLNDAKGLKAHAQVRRGDGTIEDPSVILGMKKP